MFARYTAAKVFVDLFLDLFFVYMQKDQSSKEFMKAKVTLSFISRCMVSYCGVNAHHQNGRAEKRIRDLQDQARVLIMKALNKYQDTITPHLGAICSKDGK